MPLTERQKARTRRLLKEHKTHAQIAKMIRETTGTINAYVANLTRQKDGDRIRKGSLLILDCTSEDEEQKSEGLFLNELVRILSPRTDVRIEKIDKAKSFLDWLGKSQSPTIHISAHGATTKAPDILMENGGMEQS
jgi:hypothetical protein